MTDQPSFLLSTGSLFTSGLKYCSRVARKGNFDGLELILNDPRLLDENFLRRECGGMPIKSLHAPFRSWSKWGGHLKAWEKTVRLGEKLDEAVNITLHPPALNIKQIPHFWWFTKSKNLQMDLDSSVPVSLENLPLALESTGMEGDAWAAHLKMCTRRHTGLTMDICHLGVSRMDILDCLKRTPEDLLLNIHFSDSRGIQEHLWPGTGELDMDSFLSYLSFRRYTGLITLEVSPDELPDDESSAVESLKSYLDWIRAYFSHN
mgnify:CR=1 FL=1